MADRQWTFGNVLGYLYVAFAVYTDADLDEAEKKEIFVALSEVVGLDDVQVLERRRVAVDDNVIHHFECSKVDGTYIFWNIGSKIRLRYVLVGSQAGNENITLGLCVEQMTNMARMNYIKRTMTHDYFGLTRSFANNCAKLLYCLDFVVNQTFT